MWQVVGTPIDAERFEPFRPLQLLNYYDGPRIFTVRDAEGSLCLACWSDDDERQSRFLVAPITQHVVTELEAGLVSLREALAQPRLWVVDLNHEGPVAAAWSVAPNSIPEDAQPQPGTMLRRSLTPSRSLQIEGGPTETVQQTTSKRL